MSLDHIIAYEEIEKSRIELRDAIRREIKAKNMTQKQLAACCQIDEGDMSRMLNVKRDAYIPLLWLGRITTSLGLAPDVFYPLYIGELFHREKLSSQRCREFLPRCAAVDMLHLVERVASFLLSADCKHTATLFDVAESLMRPTKAHEQVVAHKKQAAVYLYEQVIAHEPDVKSERIEISHYRRFVALQSSDVATNWELAVQMKTWLSRLPVHYQLDAYMNVVELCFIMENWSNMEKYADKMISLAHAQFTYIKGQIAKGKRYTLPETDRPLIMYYGKGYLAKGTACQMTIRFNEMQRCIDVYENLDEFQLIGCEQTLEKIKTFKKWARANRYTADMLMGNLAVLDDYVQYLSTHPTEIMSGLETIMQACVSYDFSVEHILERFHQQIASFQHETNPIMMRKHLSFRYHKALYEYRAGQYEQGIDETLTALELARRLANYDLYQDCLEWFNQYRGFATAQQWQEYSTILARRDRNI